MAVRKAIFTILICGFFSTNLFAQNRIVGYLPLYNLRQPDISKIPFSQVTHLNLAFVRPDSAGNVSILPWIDSVISIAHANGVYVSASIGGGNPPPYYRTLLAERKDAFTSNLLQLVKDHSLDGIDVDIEGTLIDSSYEPFVTQLSIQLKRERKLLTAAVGTWVSARITDKALQVFDFINIMSYDKTGPWTPNNPGPHAPMAMAISDLDHWKHSRHVAAGKLVLGLPFYGYRFGKTIGSMSYGDILLQDSLSRDNDSLRLPDNTVVYYNGVSTILEKTKLAHRSAGGVMIWQLLQDAPGNNSLLGVINTVIRSRKNAGRK